MASIDNLPPDQRAVLQLVLQRGRRYDEIAEMLSIDRAAVRDRALAALDALGPQTRVPRERRSLITDYLLGQLPPRIAEQTRDRLAESPGERAWTRVIASELGPIAGHPLPEIPADTRAPASPPPAQSTEPEPGEAATLAAPAPESARSGGDGGEDRSPPAGQPLAGGRPSSRRGGAILLGLGALIVVAVVVIVIATGGSGKKHTTSTTASTPAKSSSTATTSTAARVVAQINLVSPSGGSKTAGIAEVLRQGSTNGIAIVAQGVPPNTKHNAYAVWLYNSASDSRLLGFVNPGVGSNGRLSTAGGLPTNASHFKQLIVTLETQASPHSPGQIILEGALTGV